MRKQAAAIPTTGRQAVEHFLKNTSLEALEKQARTTLKSGKKTEHARAIATLHLVQGLKRNNLAPADLLISSVPVLPAAFRPVSKLGDTVTPGDANELYRDTLLALDAHKRNTAAFGEASHDDERLVHDSVRALYGLGEPTNPKTAQRDVKGFLHKVTGDGPKFSWVQRKLLSKPVDHVGRGVLGLNPNLGLDEVEIPESTAWAGFGPHVQRRLALQGMAPVEALTHIKDRTPLARKALELEMAERPVVVSRAPAWHMYNTVGQYAKIHDGDTININSWVGSGQNADHDGDQVNVHVPATAYAVKDIKEKLMASKMLFSNRDFSSVVPVPKHEHVLGTYTASVRPSTMTHNFATEDEAEAAIRSGKVKLHDDITIGNGQPKPPVAL